MEDARACVQDAGAAEIDDLVYAVGSGEAKRAGVLLDRLLAEQTSTVAILRAAQAYQALRLIFLQLRQRLAIASPLRFRTPNDDTT